MEPVSALYFTFLFLVPKFPMSVDILFLNYIPFNYFLIIIFYDEPCDPIYSASFSLSLKKSLLLFLLCFNSVELTIKELICPF